MFVPKCSENICKISTFCATIRSFFLAKETNSCNLFLQLFFAFYFKHIVYIGNVFNKWLSWYHNMFRIRVENRIHLLRRKKNELFTIFHHAKDLIKNSILLLHASSCKDFPLLFPLRKWQTKRLFAFTLFPILPYNSTKKR